MFKKILAAGVALALFACSPDKGEDNTPTNSSKGGGTISSSSAVVVPIQIAENGEQPSILLQTFYYTYALKANEPEDLTPYWSCSVEKQDDKPDTACQKDMTNAVLQHKLTNQYSPLHYDRVLTRINPLTRGITLKEWNLTGNGDEAAFGLNVYTDEANIQNIGERGLTNLNRIVSFEYKYVGGAHEFRVGSKTEADFWYYDVPATAGEITFDPRPEESEYRTITIPIKDLKGMGSFATNNTPFDISKAAKFLWAVKYKAGNAQNNKNSLILYDFMGYVEQ
ncbi:MAG: hypothetical protein LBC75_09270 [Fibromonadaceae bacterium]|jgi:hypothetical protein|nr:hypothetical protein [Fibromonadaceae bacterium]